MSKPNAGRTAGRFVKAKALAGAQQDALAGYLEQMRWTDAGTIKSAIGALQVGDVGNSAAVEVGHDFLRLVRPISALGQMLEAGLVRTLPPLTPTMEQTAGASAGWVAEGEAFAVSGQAFSRKARLPLKHLGAVAVTTIELLEVEHSEAVILDDLAEGVAEAVDRAFFDPTGDGSDTKTPKSVLNGVTPVPSAGSADAAAIRADLLALVAAFPGDLRRAVWVTSPRTAMALALLQSSIGDSSIILGGQSRFFGRPMFTTPALEGGTGGDYLALIDGRRLEVAGMVDATLNVSREATILMDDAPTMSSATPTGAATAVSLWQTNSVGMLASTAINWRAGANAAAMLSGCLYHEFTVTGA